MKYNLPGKFHTICGHNHQKPSNFEEGVGLANTTHEEISGIWCALIEDFIHLYILDYLIPENFIIYLFCFPIFLIELIPLLNEFSAFSINTEL